MSIFTDKYKILKQIGQGTQGVVYLGEEIIPQGETERLPKQVAIKRCVCSNSDMVSEMISEFELVSKFDHPNIIKYHDYFKNTLKDEYTDEETTEIILVMEPCDYGLSNVIKKKMDQKSVFDAQVLENWIKQICSAIKYLHELGCIHRDLKPDNILIMTGESTNEMNWTMKLVDFGCASSKEHPGGKIVGTPLYMAGEVMSENYDERVDCYSFGVLLYEMLTLKSLEHLSRDMDNIKLYQALLGNLLQGYNKFFVEICRMVINRNKDKRSKMRDVFAFIRNMGSLKPGPVISKTDLDALNEIDVDDLIEQFEGDTKRQKEFIRDMEKKVVASTSNGSTPQEKSLGISVEPKRRSADSVNNGPVTKFFTQSKSLSKSRPSSPIDSNPTDVSPHDVAPVETRPRRKSVAEVISGFFKK
jgi:serine/threonine protein kinase